MSCWITKFGDRNEERFSRRIWSSLCYSVFCTISFSYGWGPSFLRIGSIIARVVIVRVRPLRLDGW